MINREITYERDISKSYMKIPSIMEENLDEKLIFRRNYQGVIPVEKCYVNGSGQYWYNISGKQALDAYCRVNPINQSFFETLILRICNQLEVLEWNLIDTNCLVVDPELIFVNNRGEDISFILYPNSKNNFFEELQQLIEYLLTKLNHSDKDAVQAAYGIYEMTLKEGYSIADLKNTILDRREKWEPEHLQVKEEISYHSSEKQASKVTNQKETVILKEKLTELYERVKEILKSKPGEMQPSKKENRKEEIPTVIYPEDEIEEEELTIHPTVCIGSSFGEPMGMLIYEGTGNYTDFEVGKTICVIGKNHRARMRIERETISQFHAKIDYIDGTYYIEDMNSTNGTYVNEEVVNYKEKKTLKSGDIIRFADVKYRFL